MRRICLCPASIAWIRKHLMKSARSTFNKMLIQSFDKRRESRLKRTGKPRVHGKRHFSPKQLAAQRLFSKRAKAGTLRKRRRRGSR